MATDTRVSDLDAAIEIVRDNLRQLTEQAAARSGAADEDLAADRIAGEEDKLADLVRQRDELSKPA